MGDPEIVSGFVFDEEGRTDILGSPFFDVFFGFYETADDYLDRILYQLSLSLEEHIRPGRWIINSQPPPPPLPVTSLADTIPSRHLSYGGIARVAFNDLPLAPLQEFVPSFPNRRPTPLPAGLLPQSAHPLPLSLSLSLIFSPRLYSHVWEIRKLFFGFVFDEKGRTDILGSPFFDMFFGFDETADDYLDRILYQLSLSLEEHIRPRRWIINSRPPPPPLPATSPTDTIPSRHLSYGGIARVPFNDLQLAPLQECE
ncbi:hypothetical protein M5K25_004024 [Dendrobium thyrsiflorum]|uniref:Uncharacterized protein n=1 Tax=Dendrobium thyrsiflorum TaxID=117978 RepID=A0ABD0VKL5_DENTH